MELIFDPRFSCLGLAIPDCG